MGVGVELRLADLPLQRVPLLALLLKLGVPLLQRLLPHFLRVLLRLKHVHNLVHVGLPDLLHHGVEDSLEQLLFAFELVATRRVHVGIVHAADLLLELGHPLLVLVHPLLEAVLLPDDFSLLLERFLVIHLETGADALDLHQFTLAQRALYVVLAGLERHPHRLNIVNVLGHLLLHNDGGLGNLICLLLDFLGNRLELLVLFVGLQIFSLVGFQPLFEVLRRCVFALDPLKLHHALHFSGLQFQCMLHLGYFFLFLHPHVLEVVILSREVMGFVLQSIQLVLKHLSLFGPVPNSTNRTKHRNRLCELRSILLPCSQLWVSPFLPRAP
mmetsp:Transcript_7691/g.17766  ORF Transcript_7691/g.17766 Transcript_7691/m.17766 type:complete len:327 (-) Transcript_7691:696-1676(-)